MKTRNELQKEIDYLVSVLKAKDEEIAEQTNQLQLSSTRNKHALRITEQLQAELEKSKENTERLKKLLEIQETEIDKFNDIANCHSERYKQLKSKSLFQLIRWWYNAKN